MILDERTEFVDSTQPAAGTLGDVIDLYGSAIAGSPAGVGSQTAAGTGQPRDIGAGHPIYWVTVLESAVGGGPGTISLLTSASANLGTPTTLATINVLSTTPAGTKWAISLPQ